MTGAKLAKVLAIALVVSNLNLPCIHSNFGPERDILNQRGFGRCLQKRRRVFEPNLVGALRK